MPLYCTPSQLLTQEARLGDTLAGVDLDAACQLATETAREDVRGLADVDAIDAGQAPPVILQLLALSRALELAFRQYYKQGAPDNSEVTQYGQEYKDRLARLTSAVQDGRLNRMLEDARRAVSEARIL